MFTNDIVLFAIGMGHGNKQDQLKSLCCIYYLISKVVFLGLCVKVKQDYQNRMEEVLGEERSLPLITVIFFFETNQAGITTGQNDWAK